MTIFSPIQRHIHISLVKVCLVIKLMETGMVFLMSRLFWNIYSCNHNILTRFFSNKKFCVPPFLAYVIH
jgi:hypothetical protein